MHNKCTQSVEIVQCQVGLPMVYNVSLRQQWQWVKQLENGVARLVDGENYHAILIHTHTAGGKR